MKQNERELEKILFDLRRNKIAQVLATFAIDVLNTKAVGTDAKTIMIYNAVDLIISYDEKKHLLDDS